ncbi:ABATE domain-containing protein [Leifsonia sp. EB34]|uniref:CGNR zinc finger domain-containing protein n=1 Tax=Leifsonia sp. EB34 TaxID=3156303 RepID=UPI003511F10C
MGFEFVAGNLALDFVATVAERRTAAIEHLRDPADLARWFADAGVVDEPPAVDQRGLAEALRLRETIWSLLTTEADRPLVPADLRRVNRYATAPGPTAILTADRTVTTSGDLAACLAAVGRAAVELYLPGNAGRLKWCEGTDCTRAFLDASRTANRRWCGMAGCGDRAKAAAYRARKHSARP